MIISVLSNIVSLMQSGGNSYHFDFGKKGVQNLIADEKTFPGVIYDQESTMSLVPRQSGYIGEIYKPRLLILFKSELEWTPEQHDTNCITPAISAAREFISLCQNDDANIDEVNTSGDAVSVINIFDVNASGLLIQMEIKLRTNASVCVANG